MLASALESGLSLVRHFALVDVPELVQLFSNSASNLNEILRAAHPLSLVRERLRAAPDRVLDALAPAGTICLALVLAIVAFKRCICFIRATLHRAARPVDAEALLPKRSTRTRGGAAEMQHGFWLSRVLLLRAMGCVYLAAFLTSAFQSRALFGTRGLAPAGASKRPTIAYDALRSHLGEADLALECLSWVGVTFSLLLAFGSSYFALWAPLPAALWLCYLSVVNLGARVVIGYGWEWGTLEVGFLMMFLCAEWPPRDSFPRALPPPSSVLWLLRWYVFRMLLGAGMSKLGSRSSACWRDLSCTSTHYFTQPMPTPAAWVFHKLPASVHKVEVALTFFEQLVLPFGALVPIRAVQRFVALAEIFFQLMVISTGNYAWINWLAVVPAIALLDDGLLRHFVPSAMADAAAAAQSASRDGDGDDDGYGDGDDDDDDDGDDAATTTTTTVRRVRYVPLPSSTDAASLMLHGKEVGHRDLTRYYKQRFRPSGSSLVSASPRLNSLMLQYAKAGVLSSQLQVRMAQPHKHCEVGKKDIQRQARLYVKQGITNNTTANGMKHFKNRSLNF
mmetsp:Transcript_16377/g.34708  ORF Transcript_16377/g.34708 Transcript_16377/m.34708 type:complete len:563 (-) Transcript_16377:1399-3087(-)